MLFLISTLETWGCDNEAVRLPCGPSDITQHRCEEYGCCFDNSQQPACFHSEMNGNEINLSVYFKYKMIYRKPTFMFELDSWAVIKCKSH